MIQVHAALCNTLWASIPPVLCAVPESPKHEGSHFKISSSLKFESEGSLPEIIVCEMVSVLYFSVPKRKQCLKKRKEKFTEWCNKAKEKLKSSTWIKQFHSEVNFISYAEQITIKCLCSKLVTSFHTMKPKTYKFWKLLGEVYLPCHAHNLVITFHKASDAQIKVFVVAVLFCLRYREGFKGLTKESWDRGCCA